jgi:hypothetical protein
MRHTYFYQYDATSRKRKLTVNSVAIHSGNLNKKEKKMSKVKQPQHNNNNNNNSAIIPSPTTTKVTLDVDIRDRYDIVDEYRIMEDFMYSFFSAANQPRKNYLISELCKNMVATYGEHVMSGGLDADEQQVLHFIWQSKNSNLKDLLWFMGLYLLPSLLVWLRYGSKDEPPPRVASRIHFDYFVRNVLPQYCEEFFNGKWSNTDTLGTSMDAITRDLRHQYMVTVGVPLPPQFRNANNSPQFDQKH